MKAHQIACGMLLLQFSLVAAGFESFSLFGHQFTHRKNAMQNMFNAFQQMMTGEETFNTTLFDDYRSCMQSLDGEILKTQDGAWSGLVDYWQSRGSKRDAWGATPTGMLERNITKISVNDMELYEPCNTVSTLSFYRLMNEVCVSLDNDEEFNMPDKRLATVMSAIGLSATASSFYHISNTQLGLTLDEMSIRVVLYAIHQASLAGLKDASPILTDLASKGRSYSAHDAVKRMNKMYKGKSVRYWSKYLNAIDIPTYEESLTALVATILSVNYDRRNVKHAVYAFANALNMGKKQIKFMKKTYLTELERVMEEIEIEKSDRKTIKKSGMSVILKMGHAVQWRGKGRYNTTLHRSSMMNKVGSFTAPMVNKKLSHFSNNTYHTEVYQSLQDVYPGEDECEKKYPHPKWHALSSAMLLDLLHVVDDLFGVLKHPSTAVAATPESFLE